jgi:hypothetical protein
MKFYYDNTDDGYTAPNKNKVWWLRDLYGYGYSNWYPAPMYSEVRAAIDDAARMTSTPTNTSSLGLRRDWSGFKLLKISFYGDPNNSVLASDKLFVGLADGADIANPAVVTLSHSLTKNKWQEVYIPLQGTGSFKAAKPALNLANIARIHIGIGNRGTPTAGGQGNIFIDDIQLLAYGVCIPGSVAGDFTGDCQVNEDDLKALTDGWLGVMTQMASPIINLDASGLSLGTLSNWSNTGTLGGVFDDNDVAYVYDNPKVAMVDGKKAVVFDGNDLLIWKTAVGGARKMAPATLTSDLNEPNDYTIIAEVYNSEIAFEEYYFAWARNGGDATCAAFGYGTSWDFGAVAHWGLTDMGFGLYYGFSTPPASQWHKIAITYNGTTEAVVVDGVVREVEDKDLAIYQNNPVTVGCRYDYNTGTLVLTPTLNFTGAVASVKVYAGAVPPGDLAIWMGSPLDLTKDNNINFKDLAVMGLKWLQPPVLFGN